MGVTISNKPITLLDVETTGLSAQYDWIIQLSAVKFNRDTFEALGEFNRYIKPAGKWEINPEAEAVHGISPAFIEANGESIKVVGRDFLDFVGGCDLMGYNSNNFDVLMAYKDFKYSGLNFPVEDIKFYDVLAMERKIHPMNLGSVFERYVGMTMEQFGLKAHDSLSDVKATLEVFKNQMQFLDYETIDTWPENELFTPDGTVRNASKPDEPMLIVFNQGKYRDRDVYEVMKEDIGYMKWAAKNLFSSYTLKLVRDYCKTRQVDEESSKKSSSGTKHRK